MAKIDFPNQLKLLLENSDLQAHIRVLADRVGEILSDNKLTFFPDYTDHGVDHVNCVLRSEVELIPKDVWEKCKGDSDPRLLCGADAAVIIGATLLHDIAMHLQPEGFRELIGKDSRFQPLPWFRECHEGHAADRPWHELWDDYVREARRFSDRDLANIIGEESARTWKFHELPEDAGHWERNHCLVIGEFIRRHHARLAHEIAIYGFPGLPVGSGEHQFPAMGKETGHTLMRLADLIGLTARSHGMSLRVCKTYLENHYPGTPKPMGTAALYPMALLRIADYLQIDQQRAPAVLLQLRNPQSPISVQEWQKHRAVQHIGPATDPRGKMVTVSPDLSLSLYLQLQDLLDGLQREMDHSTAVLDESYGTRADLGLNLLNLSIRRIHSNLQNPAFRDSLPYVPKQTGFTADPNLLTLLVEPLYGKEPGVGVRELMQNAVDAVCELEAWCANHGKRVDELNLPEQAGDVLIEFIEKHDGSWFLRVRDKGIGMTSDTIQNYFLRAGASFRRSSEWAKEFLDEKGKPRVTRTGRFGIGAFAIFLIGPKFRLQTRHASANNTSGYEVVASENSQLIEIKRVDDLAVGTTIEVELSDETVKGFQLSKEEYSSRLGYWRPHKIDWFCWDWPIIKTHIIRKSGIAEEVTQESVCLIRKEPHLSWAAIHPEGFDEVYWTFGDAPRFSCNGLKIQTPSYGFRGIYSREMFDWPGLIQLDPPCVAVSDSAANLPLTIQRYELSEKRLPFLAELAKDVILSFIANALVCGPMSFDEAIAKQHSFPLAASSYIKVCDDKLAISGRRLSWCVTRTEFVPADLWLYSLLNARACFVAGTISNDLIQFGAATNEIISRHAKQNDIAIFIDHNTISHDEDDERLPEESDVFSLLAEQMFSELFSDGIECLGHHFENARIIVSSSFEVRSCFHVLSKSEKNVGAIWDELESMAPHRHHFEATTGACDSGLPLNDVVNEIECAMETDHDVERHWDRPAIPAFVYVAEIQTYEAKYTSESLVAQYWNECLGARAIPFDPAAREALIADACKHPELKRHIEAWQEMKRTGSKWVTGGSDN